MSAADRRKYRKPNIADEGRDYDDRDAEITSLRAELARAKSCACADCNTEILQLRTENEALRKYANHTSDCNLSSIYQSVALRGCNCGFDALAAKGE